MKIAKLSAFAIDPDLLYQIIHGLFLAIETFSCLFFFEENKSRIQQITMESKNLVDTVITII